MSDYTFDQELNILLKGLRKQKRKKEYEEHMNKVKRQAEINKAVGISKESRIQMSKTKKHQVYDRKTGILYLNCKDAHDNLRNEIGVGLTYFRSLLNKTLSNDIRKEIARVGARKDKELYEVMKRFVLVKYLTEEEYIEYNIDKKLDCLYNTTK